MNFKVNLTYMDILHAPLLNLQEIGVILLKIYCSFTNLYYYLLLCGFEFHDGFLFSTRLILGQQLP